MGYELIFHLPYKACLHFIKITVQEMYRYKATCSLSVLCVQNGIYERQENKRLLLFLVDSCRCNQEVCSFS